MHVPNIGTVLREEISRLSRRESRRQVDPARKATAQHRRDIAELKRQVAQLQRQVALLSRRSAGVQSAANDTTAKPVRFAAKGLRSQRNRLGLSAADFGKLLGMSAQSIYNWERGVAKPRAGQLAKLAALRGIGKREAGQRLEKLSSGTKAAGRKT
jgi:DNA-binding transcriptional regulator YiaG